MGGGCGDILESRIGTLHSHETGLITELPDTIIDRRTSCMDASTPVFRPNYRTRPRHFGYEWTPMPNAPPPLSPTLRTQLRPGPVDPQRVIPARVAQWQRDVYALRRSSAAQFKAQKCTFMQTKLGYIVGLAGLACDPVKLSAVRAWHNQTRLRRCANLLDLSDIITVSFTILLNCWNPLWH